MRGYARQLDRSLNVGSAGIGALVGQPAAPHSVAVMADKGIDISPHRARQLQPSDISENDLILVMETWQQKEIEKRCTKYEWDTVSFNSLCHSFGAVWMNYE